MPVESEAKFCPKCGSPLVEFTSLIGGNASCKACYWSGLNTELLSAPFQHDLGSDDNVMYEFHMDFRNTLAKAGGTELGRLFLRWGLLSSGDPAVMKAQLSRLLAAMAKGAVQALIEERAAIVKEGGA